MRAVSERACGEIALRERLGDRRDVIVQTARAEREPQQQDMHRAGRVKRQHGDEPPGDEHRRQHGQRPREHALEPQAPAGVVARFEAHRPVAEADQRMRRARLAEPAVDGDARGRQRRRSEAATASRAARRFQCERQAGDHHRGLGAQRGDALIEPPEFVDVKTRGRAERHDAEADFVADHDDLACGRDERRFERGKVRVIIDRAAGASPSGGHSRLASHSVRQSIRMQWPGASACATAPARSTPASSSCQCAGRRAR